MQLKATLMALGLLMTLCATSAALIIAILPFPMTYEAAVRTTLARRGGTPPSITIAVCPAGPTACYQRVYGVVQLDHKQTTDGFFECASGNADCLLTVPALEIRRAAMPDIAGAGPRSERLRAVLNYYGVQVRALLRVGLPGNVWWL